MHLNNNHIVNYWYKNTLVDCGKNVDITNITNTTDTTDMIFEFVFDNNNAKKLNINCIQVNDTYNNNGNNGNNETNETNKKQTTISGFVKSNERLSRKINNTPDKYSGNNNKSSNNRVYNKQETNSAVFLQNRTYSNNYRKTMRNKELHETSRISEFKHNKRDILLDSFSNPMNNKTN